MPQGESFAGEMEMVLVSKIREEEAREIQKKVKMDGKVLRHPNECIGYQQVSKRAR